MAKTIEKVEFAFPQQPQVTRVAAYGRVSRDGDAMHHSLSQQISYYSEMIQNHPGWLFCGVFADEAKTGTKDSREQFRELLTECRAGKVDLIITKSVSRFARNTVTLLESVRELKLLGIDVFFEEQNIHTMSSDGELMLTILASYAQEESRSVSENMKWRIKKNFEEGLPWNGTLLGYRLKNGKYEIVPEEAEIVKSIFADYLSGLGLEAIMKRLKSKEVKTRKDNNWHISCVRRILCNYTYTGNLLLQKYYSENHLTKKKMVNEGQLPQYHATDTHEAIISLEDFNRVQEEMERRRTKFNPPKKRPQAYPFSGLIECEKCGKNYRRKTTVTGVVWICPTFNSEGKSVCASKQIPEDELQRVTADINLASVEKIIAKENNVLAIHFKDGRSEKRIWNSRSRAESWTPEMKEAARQKTLERSKKKCQMSK